MSLDNLSIGLLAGLVARLRI